MGYALKDEWYGYLTAGTGEDALSKMLGGPIDLLLLDLGLPDMDGMEVLARIREWSAVPIIVVSAMDQDREKVDALEAGVDDYLSKPFSAMELMARIRVAFRHRTNATQQQAPEVCLPCSAAYFILRPPHRFPGRKRNPYDAQRI
ncbi:response regulator [Eubacterium aggregans]|uniref:response regulator n=1 Tax=Eubacterium aggregans TaxID=81409 RepID=UPI003F2E76A6